MSRREVTDLIFIGCVVAMICIAGLFVYAVATGSL